MSYLGTVPIRVRFVRRSFTKADHKGCIPLLIAKGGGRKLWASSWIWDTHKCCRWWF